MRMTGQYLASRLQKEKGRQFSNRKPVPIKIRINPAAKGPFRALNAIATHLRSCLAGFRCATRHEDSSEFLPLTEYIARLDFDIIPVPYRAPYEIATEQNKHKRPEMVQEAIRNHVLEQKEKTQDNEEHPPTYDGLISRQLNRLSARFELSPCSYFSSTI